MATSRLSSGLLVRLDARDRSGLQRQIRASIQRAILDGVVAPGTRLPSSRALAEDLGVSRTTTLLAVQQLQAEGYLTGRRGAGTFVAEELPDDLPRQRGTRPGRRLRHPTLSRRGAALVAAPQGAHRLDGPPRAFRIGTPGVDLFPVALWWRLASARRRSITPRQLDYGEPAGLRALREAIAGHVQTARGTRCGADQILVVAGAQQGLELISRVLLDPDDRVWMEEPGYPGARSALLGAGARILPVPVDAEGLDVEMGARRANDARLVYVTPSHQYP
ncbi:MAG: PLP-dependent aminotransferase family protein, partial [Candidatus Rokuibacteriota bacterium]